jgi:iron complex transport system substrate-binding protein
VGDAGLTAGPAASFERQEHNRAMHMTLRAASALALTGLLALTTTAVTAAPEPLTITDVDGVEVAIEDTSRVATLGGVFTETVYALGAQDQLTAIDASSFHPPEALEEKPNFGYYRFLSAEPVLAQGPSLIIGNEETGPPEVVQQLRDAGVPILLLPDNNDVSAARDLITTLGAIFGREEAATALIEQLDADVAVAGELVAGATSSPRVLFILQPPEAPLLVAGAVTAAGSMIELAGGTNVYPGFPSYIPMTPEGIVETAPDVILTTTRSVERLGGWDGFLEHPGVSQTPAAADGRVVAMDDLYLLGFGPRTGQAIADLALLLHPELAP